MPKKISQYLDKLFKILLPLNQPKRCQWIWQSLSTDEIIAMEINLFLDTPVGGARLKLDLENEN